MPSMSSFDHGCLSGRASAYSLGSFKHVYRTKDEEDALWANHMVRGGVSREDLAADNDISDFQVQHRPLIVPASVSSSVGPLLARHS